jgi:hypothetical protein
MPQRQDLQLFRALPTREQDHQLEQAASEDVQKRHDQEQPPGDGKSGATPTAPVNASATHD